MPHEFIKTENRDGVLTITMHDPTTRNALGPDMVREIVETLDHFERDPEQRVFSPLQPGWRVGRSPGAGGAFPQRRSESH